MYPLSKGIHSVSEFKYIIDNVNALFVHLDIPHAFTSGGMASVIEYINTFRGKIIHVHWHDNHGQVYSVMIPVRKIFYVILHQQIFTNF